MFIDKLKRIESLPVLPEVTLRIQNLLLSNDGNAKDLEELVVQDSSLSAAILKVANSALYNYSGKRITDIKTAIVRLGRNEIEKLLLGLSVVKVLPSCDLIDATLVWQRSFVASSLIERLIKESSLEFFKPAELKIAGLLQHTGLLVLAMYFEKHLTLIDSDMQMKRCSFLEAENHLFKSDLHAELGSALLEIWRFPSDIYLPVRFQSSPAKAPDTYRREAFLLNCVETIINLVTPSPFSTEHTTEEVTTIMTQNGVDINHLPELIDYISVESDKALSLLSMWGLGDSIGKIRSTGNTLLLRPV